MAMEKTFNAAEAEARLLTAWEQAGCFKAGANAKPEASTYSIMRDSLPIYCGIFWYYGCRMDSPWDEQMMR